MRTRNFCGLCYEEQLIDLMNYVRLYTDNGTIRFWAIIKHEPESEEKKEHYHFVIEYYNARTVTSINKHLGFRDGLINACGDLRSYCCYMLHKYEIDKKNYFLKQVDSNNMERFTMFVNSENANQCSSDKELWYKFSDLALNSNLFYFEIIDILCKDKNIDVKSVRRNAYLFKTFYDSIIK